jgi:hypothetical protein
VAAAVGRPASGDGGRGRRHGLLGAQGVVERVHLEPDGAAAGDDPAALLPVAAVRDERDDAVEAAVAVVVGEVPRALRHAVDVREGRDGGLPGREHPRGRERRPRREVAHQRAEPRPELLRLRRVLRVPRAEPHRRVGRAQETRVGVPQQALVVDKHGVLLAGAGGGHVPRSAVQAREARRRVDVAAALREAVGLVGRGACEVVGEPVRRGRGGGEGGEERVEVGLERAPARVVRVARALGVPQVVGYGGCGEQGRAEEEEEGEEAPHGSQPRGWQWQLHATVEVAGSLRLPRLTLVGQSCILVNKGR